MIERDVTPEPERPGKRLSQDRLSSSGPEPFEACPDGGRCWHYCPMLSATQKHPEGEGVPCWRVLNAVPIRPGRARWTKEEKVIHRKAQTLLEILGERLWLKIATEFCEWRNRA